MKTRLALIIAFAFVLLIPTRADELEDLQGKWTTHRKNSQGDTVKQTIEIKKSKLTFTIFGAGDEPRFIAEADLELKKAGPFHSMRLNNLRAGDSASNLNDVSDDYQLIYILTTDGLSVASNFDKERDNRKPTVDTYTKSGK
jgi:hypothetical protein